MTAKHALRPYRSCMVCTVQDLERGCESITTHYDDGEVRTITRGLLHGPWPPTVYRVRYNSEGEECLPYIEQEKWSEHNTYGEFHPWYITPGRQYYAGDPAHLSLIVNRQGWVTAKKSLRPQLQRALRTWHTKLTADLADAEEALVDALFKPL